MRNKIIFFLILFLFFASSSKANFYMYLGSSADSKVYIYDVTNLAHTLVGSVDVGKDPSGIAVSLDGSRVYVANNGSKSVSVIDTSTNTKITDVTVGNGPFSVIIDPDDSRVFVANVSDSTLSVIDAKKVGVDPNPIIGNPITTGDSPSGLAITSNGARKRLYVANLISGTISVFDISSSDIKPLPSFNLASIPRGANPFERPIGIAAKNDFLFITHNEVGSKKSYVSVFQETNTGINYLNTSREVGLLPQQAIVSSDFQFLYVVSTGPPPSVSIINVSSADKTKIGSASTQNIGFSSNGLSITPDGSKIFIPSTSSDKEIVYVDKANGNIITKIGNTIFHKSNTIGNFIGPDLNPQLAANPASIDFGTQNLNSSVPPQTLTLTYKFVASMINTISSNSSDFPITHNCELTVSKPIGTNCTVTINIKSDTVGDKTGALVIESSASNNRIEIPLKGTIQDPNAPPRGDTGSGGNGNGGGCSLLSSEVTFGFGLLGILWLTPFVYLRLKKAKQRSQYRQ